MTHEQILNICLKRMRRGVKKHGRFDARKDTRDLYSEAQEECYDVINYMAMQIQKLEVMKQKHGEKQSNTKRSGNQKR